MFRYVAAIFILSLLGICLGLGAYTFVYAKGASYLSNDPAACANCHVMNEQYDGWIKSSHHAVAGCNDCHTPHDFFGKYATKALNGFNHSWMFTLGGFHEPIRIGDRNRIVTENTCRHCHAAIARSIGSGHHYSAGKDDLKCTECHQSVGHLH